MALFDVTHQPNPISVAAGHVGHVIADAVGSFFAWRDRIATRQALSGLTDRELDDIGLIRSDIHKIT